MKPLNFSCFTLFLGVVVAGSGLTACSPTIAENSSPTSPSSSSMQGMDHSKMGHTMDLGPADAEFDLRFIDSMIPHHQGGVDMAKEVLQKSKRPELKKLAQAIIAAQDKEISQMRQWRKAWYLKAPENPIAWHAGMNHSMPMSKEQIQAMKMSMDLGVADEQFDLRFINAMIPHHQGAVTMAKDVLQRSKRPEVQKLAQEIISSQESEINQMSQWRKAWYNQ